MKYANLKYNDVANGPGVNVSFWVQGCPNHCSNCQNPETWDFNGGKEFTNNTFEEIFQALRANGIHRDFCILGGEPLCEQNQLLTLLLINAVKEKFPDVKIYIWTGYYYEDLIKQTTNGKLQEILNKADVLIDGPYIQSQRDITLPMRGSKNQSIINLKEVNKCDTEEK